MESPNSLGAGPAGSMLMKTTTQAFRPNCICNTEECRKLTKAFRNINDVRGKFFCMPILGGPRMKELKEFKIDRTLFHLGLDPSVKEGWKYTRSEEEDATNENAANDSGETSKKSKQPSLKDRKFIAYHHYHPSLLEYFTTNNDKTLDYLPASLIVKLGLVNNGYTDDDIFRGFVEKLKRIGEDSVFVPVPSYKHAEDDLERLRDRIQLNNVIQTCRDKYRGYKILSKIGVSQRTKLLTDDITEVERAVSILADRVEELELEKKRLEEALKEKPNPSNNLVPQIVQYPAYDVNNNPSGHMNSNPDFLPNNMMWR